MRGAISKEIDVVAGLHAKQQTGRLTESARSSWHCWTSTDGKP